MLKIDDKRLEKYIPLRNLEGGSFFEFDGVLLRKVQWYAEDMKIDKGENEAVAMQMYDGMLCTLDLDDMVFELSDAQIALEIQD